MRVLVTGASGLVGQAVVQALVARGDEVVALSREPGRHAWPAGVQPLQWDARSPLPDVEADAVVNLAGERVIGRRWTASQMGRMRDSRIGVTRRVVEWIASQPGPPPLVSASAAGYYGFRAEGPCLEPRPAGEGFLAELAKEWEAEASQAPGRRVVLRFGPVLSPAGGYLGTILPFARLHLAGPIAGGQQPMPWVHVDDAVAAVLWALDQPVAGTFNVVSPGAAGRTQREFARALAKACGKRLQLAVPPAAIRLRFGQGAGPALAGGQDLRSTAIERAGFSFRHRELGPALSDLLGSRPAA